MLNFKKFLELQTKPRLKSLLTFYYYGFIKIISVVVENIACILNPTLEAWVTHVTHDI